MGGSARSDQPDSHCIVYVITGSDAIGGANVPVRDFTLAMCRTGDDASVLIGGEGSVTQEFRDKGVPYRGVMRDYWKNGESATGRYKARLAELVRPGMRILHAGCGWDKRDVSRPYRETCEVIGVDIDPRVAPMFHSQFHLASLSNVPLPSGSFDLIFCEYVVEHLDDPAAALREMRRVLKPGGRILVLTPNLLSYKGLAAAYTPQHLHIWMGRIRYGRGHEADMYPTLYRCNTTARFRRLAREAGLEMVRTELVTNGPTWFEKFPGLFELFHVFHRAIARWEPLSQLRCAMIVECACPKGRHATDAAPVPEDVCFAIPARSNR